MEKEKKSKITMKGLFTVITVIICVMLFPLIMLYMLYDRIFGGWKK